MDSPEPPAAPNYAQANVSGVAADVATLAARNQINQAQKLGISTTYQLPVMDANGNITGWNPAQTADFTGMGDTAAQQQMLDLAKSSTPEILALRQQYGVDYVNQQRAEQQASDPEAFALRQGLGQQLQDELAKGGDMTPAQTRMVQQATREAQTARGNVLGVAPAVQETMAQFDVGEQLKQRRQSAAQAFVFGQPLASYNVSTAQQGASPMNPMGYNSGIGLDPNAGNNSANFAANIYGTQSANWRTQQSQQDPFLGLGMGVLSTGLGAATGGMGYGLAGAAFPWMQSRR